MIAICWATVDMIQWCSYTSVIIIFRNNAQKNELIVLNFPQNLSRLVFLSSMVIHLWECSRLATAQDVIKVAFYSLILSTFSEAHNMHKRQICFEDCAHIWGPAARYYYLIHFILPYMGLVAKQELLRDVWIQIRLKASNCFEVSHFVLILLRCD